MLARQVKNLFSEPALAGALRAANGLQDPPAFAPGVETPSAKPIGAAAPAAKIKPVPGESIEETEGAGTPPADPQPIPDKIELVPEGQTTPVPARPTLLSKPARKGRAVVVKGAVICQSRDFARLNFLLQESKMRTVQEGDRVRVHFVKRSQRGEGVSLRGHTPLELEVGTENRLLPGLGLALVGMSVGQEVTVRVPAHLAYGPVGPERLRRVVHSRFKPDQNLTVGRWVRVTACNGRRRLVRVVAVHEKSVVVDTNRRSGTRWNGIARGFTR